MVAAVAGCEDGLPLSSLATAQLFWTVDHRTNTTQAALVLGPSDPSGCAVLAGEVTATLDGVPLSFYNGVRDPWGCPRGPLLQATFDTIASAFSNGTFTVAQGADSIRIEVQDLWGPRGYARSASGDLTWGATYPFTWAPATDDRSTAQSSTGSASLHLLGTTHQGLASLGVPLELVVPAGSGSEPAELSTSGESALAFIACDGLTQCTGKATASTYEVLTVSGP